MGVLIPVISSTATAAVGVWLAHNASKGLADGEGTYTGQVLVLLCGVVVIMSSGLVNKMLE